MLVRKLRERHHTDGPGTGGGGGGGGDGGGGEGDRGTVEGSGVLQNHDVIFPSEADHGGDQADQLLNPREPQADYERRLAENYSNISFRPQPDPSLENYASDQWDERTHIKLNPLYHNYS